MEAQNGRTLPVSDHDYDLIAEVGMANDWSVAEAAHRAVQALWTLHQQLLGLQERHPGEVADLIGQLRRHLPSDLLVGPKTMRKVEEERPGGDRSLGIGIDEFLFDQIGGYLWAERRVPIGESERLEIYRVRDGRLTLSNSGLLSAPPDPEGVELT